MTDSRCFCSAVCIDSITCATLLKLIDGPCFITSASSAPPPDSLGVLLLTLGRFRLATPA